MFKSLKIFKKPQARQEWIDNKIVTYKESIESEPWVELFIDLVYVALLYKLGAIIVECDMQAWVFGMCFCIFWSLCLTRMAIDEYANRFYSHDLMHRIWYLIYTAGVFVQVINVNGFDTASTYETHTRYLEENAVICTYVPKFFFGLFVGIFITRCSIIIIYLIVMQNNKVATNQFILDVYCWGLTLLICITDFILHITGNSSKYLDFALLVFIVCQETLSWIMSRTMLSKSLAYPLDIESLQKRWGEWVMIVIGEGVIQVLIAPVSTHNLIYDYKVKLFSLFLTFSLTMQYYDSFQREWFEHALTQSSVAGLIWIWLHPLSTYALFLIGVSLKILTSNYSIYHGNRLLSLMCGLFTLANNFARYLHKSDTKMTKNTLRQIILRIFFSLLQISGLFFLKSTKPSLVLYYQTGISVFVFNVLDIFFQVEVKVSNLNVQNDEDCSFQPAVNSFEPVKERKRCSSSESIEEKKMLQQQLPQLSEHKGENNTHSDQERLLVIAVDPFQETKVKKMHDMNSAMNYIGNVNVADSHFITTFQPGRKNSVTVNMRSNSVSSFSPSMVIRKDNETSIPDSTSKQWKGSRKSSEGSVAEQFHQC